MLVYLFSLSNYTDSQIATNSQFVNLYGIVRKKDTFWDCYQYFAEIPEINFYLMVVAGMVETCGDDHYLVKPHDWYMHSVFDIYDNICGYL